VPLPPGSCCAHCDKPLDLTRRSTARYCDRECKERATVVSGRQRKAALKSYYKRRYGLTPEQVDAMRAAGCAICGAPDSVGRWKKLHVDHDHKTGEVRGVLCDNCNHGLGHFKDSPELLSAARSYLLDFTP
jgi:hypothetical protein